MTSKQDAEPYLPGNRTITALRSAAATCEGCHLHENATQTVFGSGPASARLVLVGEQPGDKEDIEGEPFVGPAGALLDKALVEVGIARDEVYLTNAVKHFKFRPAERGKRRIHKPPSRTEAVACRPWLLAELEAVTPQLVVLLGATAGKSVFGGSFTVTPHRGDVLELPDPFPALPVVPTVHPSSVLRSRERDKDYAAFTDDLRAAVAALGG